MVAPKTFSGVSFWAIDNDKDVTKDRNSNTFKMYCKRKKSGVRFPDRKPKKIVCMRVIALLAMCQQQESHLPSKLLFCLSSLCQTRSSLCLFFVYPTYHIHKSKPGACLGCKRERQARATTETAVRKCERSTKEPIATNPSISKDSWASCGYDTLNCAILSKYELLRASDRRQFASARRQIGTGLFFSFKLLSISL